MKSVKVSYGKLLCAIGYLFEILLVHFWHYMHFPLTGWKSQRIMFLMTLKTFTRTGRSTSTSTLTSNGSYTKSISLHKLYKHVENSFLILIFDSVQFRALKER